MKVFRNFGILIILTLIFGSSVLAATVTVPAANTNTANNRKPLGSYFGFERTAAIYTAAEHGLVSGSTITDVCWYVNSVSTPGNSPTTIYMSTTAATTFTAGTFASEISGATTVFTGTILGSSLTAGAFKCVTLTAPFNYTSGNLKVMVQVDATGAGNETIAAKQFRWSAGASETWQADTTAPTGNGTTSTTTRPNIQFIYTPPSGPGTLQFSSATYAGNEGTSVTVTVSRVGGQTGAVSVDYATSDGTATSADYTSASGTLNWADADSAAKTFTVPLSTDVVLDPSETVNLTLSNVVGTTITGTNPAVLTITDVPPPLNGVYSVPGDFPSLTNAGGIFERLNLSGATGNITINIAADLTGETGTNAINPITGNFPVLIKPSGGPRTVSGVAPIAVIRINGADNIRIDGSTSASVVGGTPALRELTVQNLSTSTSSGVIAIGSASESSTGNTIQNVNVLGNDPIQTLLGISSGGATPGTVALFPNNNTVIQNCSVRRAIFGIYSAGVAATSNTGTVITQNDISATTTDRVSRVGILVFNENGVQITENSVGGLSITTSNDAIGIGVGTQAIDTTSTTSGGVTNALISRNKINGVTSLSTSGFSAAGITVAGGTGGENIIANNMITGVISPATSPDFPSGIYVVGAAGSNTKLYYNSVAMTGNRGTVTGQMPSFGVAITGADPVVEVKNNIFYNTQEPGSGGVDAKAFAIGVVSATFANLDANYNAFYSAGTQPGFFRSGAITQTGGTSYATLALWQAAISDDANSVSVDPAFLNPLNELHITIGSPVIDLGTIISVTNDFDGTDRALGFVGGVPDIGADELTAPTAASAFVQGRVLTPSGKGLLNANVVLTNTNTGEIRYGRTTSLGYFTFRDLPVGDFYVLEVRSKRYVFNSQSFTLNEDLSGMILTGQ